MENCVRICLGLGVTRVWDRRTVVALQFGGALGSIKLFQIRWCLHFLFQLIHLWKLHEDQRPPLVHHGPAMLISTGYAMGVTRCGRVHAAPVTTQITRQVPRLKAVEQAEQKATARCLRLAPNLWVTLCQTCAASSQSERASAPFCSNLKYTFMLRSPRACS